MSFFFIFLGLIFIIYLISYSNRDKSKDYLYQRHPTVSLDESQFMFDIGESLDNLIEKAEVSSLNILEEIESFKKSRINDLSRICREYKIDERRARQIISVCIESRLKDLKK